jgi:hypothetical protein
VRWARAADSGGVEVAGRVVNPSGAGVYNGVVAVILLDARGRILGAVYDNTDASVLPAGARAEFRTSYPLTPPIDPRDVASVRTVAVDLSRP